LSEPHVAMTMIYIALIAESPSDNQVTSHNYASNAITWGKP